MRRVFISHPYSGRPENVEAAREIVADTLRRGVFAYCPVLMFGDLYDDSVHRGEIMDICYRLIDTADEVWVFGSSPGTLNEMDYAQARGKFVRFFIGDGFYE